MLTSLRIQNFRSIRDASVKLGQVNLFIGPNNSGKSNFLKGIEFIAARVTAYPEKQAAPIEWYEQNLLRGKLDVFEPPAIQIQLNDQLSNDELCEVNYSVQGDYVIDKTTKNTLQSILLNTRNGLNIREELDLSNATPSFRLFPRDFHTVRTHLTNCIIYKPDPGRFQAASPISNETLVAADSSNLVSFLFYLSQNHKTKFRQLENDLAQYVGDLVSVSTPADPGEAGKFKLKFFDKNDIGYWAEEVSEGVLYFLALLCIVHQPDPPKLLLLEEPEKGIHPRRIREVMDFIFELARLRDIQIILTSHSPYVVDYFADIPECISVFDRENGETVIHNAGDIISETNDKLRAEGKKLIRYSDSLGEHWVSGFLGGVPA
ncbi:AAA family ATPase [Hymenobacter sp.]|uniref:AAA family ATPase n=1 Tax=Hymenobacter sp. TaxID=1898978 RepID=UPI00286D5B7D|nr:AAA family ATPase [Hymenobacter sp.]